MCTLENVIYFAHWQISSGNQAASKTLIFFGLILQIGQLVDPTSLKFYIQLLSRLHILKDT